MYVLGRALRSVPQRPYEGVRFPRGGVTSGYKLPQIVAEKQTQVLCKSNTFFNFCAISPAPNGSFTVTYS